MNKIAHQVEFPEYRPNFTHGAFFGVIVHQAPAAALMTDAAIQERYCAV